MATWRTGDDACRELAPLPWASSPDLSLRIPGSQGPRTQAGPPRSHLMDQVGDLVLPPLLACRLLTFLLQGRETQP